MVCLRQAEAVSVAGHPRAAFNGVYTHDSTHKGWPVLKNVKGVYCYRHEATEVWQLRQEFWPDEAASFANVTAPEGPLPLGARTWDCSVDNSWERHTVTVTIQ